MTTFVAWCLLIIVVLISIYVGWECCCIPGLLVLLLFIDPNALEDKKHG